MCYNIITEKQNNTATRKEVITMKKTFNVNGRQVTFTDIIADFGSDGDKMEALLIHDEGDEYNEGDVIAIDYMNFPETDEEAAEIVNNVHLIDAQGCAYTYAE